MRNFRSVLINTDDNTAWVQAGATLGQLYHALARESKTLAFPAGACPTVGVGGHFSGGGYGMLSRKHAIASDQIVDAIVMNADGQKMDRASMGEDHFWAIRGGGGTSFGIILAFKANLVTVPETVTVFNVSRTLEQNATQIVHRWQYVANEIDENLLFVHFAPSPITKNRTVQATFSTLYLGRARDLVPMMDKEFPELGLVEEDCIEMSWIESVLFFADLQNQSLDALLQDYTNSDPGSDMIMHFKGKSDIVTKPIPVRGLKGIWRFFINEPMGDMAELELSPYGGALTTFSDSETPFPHRSGTLFMIRYAILWHDHEDPQGKMDWIRRLYSYMAPYVSKSPRLAYFNYRDLEIGMNNNQGNYTSYKQASVWGRKYFKNKFDRLVRVKTKVDPSNFFRNEQSIPPLYEEIASS